MSKTILVALAGSPNVGKSTLFNVLTGSKQHVGNWPGKTVERYEGRLTHHGREIRIVDLPGTYSLSAISDEEVIARDFIAREKPDVVVIVVNAVELQQSLYLVLQVLELTNRVVLAVNKIDAAQKRGIHIRCTKLSSMLGVPVAPISALHKVGIHRLVELILDVAEGRLKPKGLKLNYGAAEYYINMLKEIADSCDALRDYPPRWIAIRLLEGDPELAKRARSSGCELLLKRAEEVRRKAERELGTPVELYLINRRYEFISKLWRECVKSAPVAAPTLTTRLDSVFLHPVAGPLASLALVFALLLAVFTANTGFPLNIILENIGMSEASALLERYSLAGILGYAFSLAADYAERLLTPLLGAWLARLIAEGVIEGVGGVIGFFPLILSVYAVYGFLEDTGLMARLAVVGDRFARPIGLSGKAIIPLFLGFGCNVPSILGNRILERDEEKVLANLLAPLVPCQARLIVTVALASAFFTSPLSEALAVVMVYAVALSLVFILGFLFRKTLFREYRVPDLLIELPPYHRPSLRVIAWHAWDKSSHFLRKAGTIILALSVVVWLLSNVGPSGPTDNVENTFAALLGKSIAPVTSLAGLGDWRIALALEAGLVAKEGVISTILLITGAPTVSQAVANLGLTAPQLLSLLVIIAVYTPCAATIAAFHSETRNGKYTVILVAYELLIALLLGAAVYAIASLFT